MSKHTPGPWEAHGYYVNAKEGYNVADCDIGPAHRSDDRKMANARLCAAAPTMLEVLEQAEHWLEASIDDPDTKPDEILRVIRGVLVNARGL